MSLVRAIPAVALSSLLVACGTDELAGTTPADLSADPSADPALEDALDVERRYIVVLRDGAAGRAGLAPRPDDPRLHDAALRHVPAGVLGAVQRLEDRLRFRADRVYGAALHGFAARLSDAQLAALAADPDVLYVEPDGIVTAYAQLLPWGVNRVDADISSTIAGDGLDYVPGVNVYIIDTGIGSHVDLGVAGHVNFAGGSNTDCQGHGTHLAGIAAAKDDDADVVGVAPGARLWGVKVLSCSGSGTYAGVISGIDWVTANAQRPAVANLSLGGGANSAVDDAVRSSAASGVLYTIAAGGGGSNACNYSPARLGAGTNNGIVTVAATDASNNEMPGSNYGPCVDLWAPGANIPSTRLGGGLATFSGTSMAAAHVAGGGALYQRWNPTASSAAAEAALKAAAWAPGTRSKDNRLIQLLNVGSF